MTTPDAHTQSFKATITKAGSRVYIKLPFDPNAIWGDKAQHHIHGTINHCQFRGALGVDGEVYFILLGEAWRRDNSLDAGATVEVTIFPEGPQAATIAADVAAALNAEAHAKAFFEALPTFYRKNYMRWIESAKRPATRAARIAEMIELLKASKRQK